MIPYVFECEFVVQYFMSKLFKCSLIIYKTVSCMLDCNTVFNVTVSDPHYPVCLSVCLPHRTGRHKFPRPMSCVLDMSGLIRSCMYVNIWPRTPPPAPLPTPSPQHSHPTPLRQLCQSYFLLQ